VDIPFYRGEALLPGNQVRGPAVILRSDTTLLLLSGDMAIVDPFGNVRIKID
jgi:N-methylhydantoinase A/oxoprolinase/acetone carboxylase beta subunit